MKKITVQMNYRTMCDGFHCKSVAFICGHPVYQHGQPQLVRDAGGNPDVLDS